MVQSQIVTNDREELGIFDVSWLGLLSHIRQIRRDTKKEVAIHPDILVNEQRKWVPFLDGNGNWLKDLSSGNKNAELLLKHLKISFPSKTIAVYKSGTSFHIYPEGVVMNISEYSQFCSKFSVEKSEYLDNNWFMVPTEHRGLRWSTGEEERPEPSLIKRITL